MLDKFGHQSAACVPVSSADLQLKLTDTKSSLAAAGMGMENGTGQKLIEITGPALSKRKLLVGLDLLCLFLGKNQNTQQKKKKLFFFLILVISYFTCGFVDAACKVEVKITKAPV